MSLSTSLVYLTKVGITVDYIQRNGDSYIARARNTLVNDFLKTDFTHLLFIDSDMSWGLDSLKRILDADFDVVGAGYPSKNKWDHFSCILNNDKRFKPVLDNNGNEQYPPIVNEFGLISAWSIPTGFMKIRREVFEKMSEYYFDHVCQDDNGNNMFDFFGHISRGGKILGEDVSFCRKWAEMGGELWVEPRCTMGHWGVKEWVGNYHEFLMKQPRPT
jgi:hypothetical protein